LHEISLADEMCEPCHRLHHSNGNGTFRKKGKDVDLYSTFHAPGTPNAHITETGPPDRYLGHRQACKHSPGSDPITGTGSTSQLVGLHLRNPPLMAYYSFGWLAELAMLVDR